MKEETNDSPSPLEMRLRRRSLFKGAALGATGLSLPSLLAACGGGSTTTTTTQTEGMFPSHPQWNFVFVNHVTTNPFFTPTQYGIADVTSLLGCKSKWTGSATSRVCEL